MWLLRLAQGKRLDFRAAFRVPQKRSIKKVHVVHDGPQVRMSSTR
jgi:hypothetical protein